MVTSSCSLKNYSTFETNENDTQYLRFYLKHLNVRTIRKLLDKTDWDSFTEYEIKNRCNDVFDLTIIDGILRNERPDVDERRFYVAELSLHHLSKSFQKYLLKNYLVTDSLIEYETNYADSNNLYVVVEFNDDLVIKNPNTGGELHVHGKLTGGNDDSLHVYGSGNTTTLDDATVSVGGEQLYQDSVVVTGVSTINAGGYIRIGESSMHTLNGGSASGTDDNLTLTPGADKDVIFGGAVGDHNPLEMLTITRGRDVIFNGETAVDGPLSITVTDDVIRLAMIQWLICPWGYGFLGVASICNGSFNAFGRPLPAMTISISRTLVIYVPLAYAFAHYFGFQGIFIAQVLANIFADCVAIVWYRRIFKEVAN